jgi:hypothetical protein
VGIRVDVDGDASQLFVNCKAVLSIHNIDFLAHV